MRGRGKPSPHYSLAQERKASVSGTLLANCSMLFYLIMCTSFPGLRQSAEDALQLGSEESPEGILGLGFTRSRLFIDCFQPQDEGTYTCVAENAFERQSASSLVEVAPSSELLIESNDITLCTSKKSAYGMSSASPDILLNQHPPDNVNPS